MSNNPRECLEQARYCADLACTGATPEDREYFASLAKSWIRLAGELEDAQAFSDEPKHSEAACMQMIWALSR